MSLLGLAFFHIKRHSFIKIYDKPDDFKFEISSFLFWMEMSLVPNLIVCIFHSWFVLREYASDFKKWNTNLLAYYNNAIDIIHFVKLYLKSKLTVKHGLDARKPFFFFLRTTSASAQDAQRLCIISQLATSETSLLCIVFVAEQAGLNCSATGISWHLRNGALVCNSTDSLAHLWSVPSHILKLNCNMLLSHGMYLYQVMMTLHFLNDAVNDSESKRSIITSYSLIWWVKQLVSWLLEYQIRVSWY